MLLSLNYPVGAAIFRNLLDKVFDDINLSDILYGYYYTKIAMISGGTDVIFYENDEKIILKSIDDIEVNKIYLIKIIDCYHTGADINIIGRVLDDKYTIFNVVDQTSRILDDSDFLAYELPDIVVSLFTG